MSRYHGKCGRGYSRVAKREKREEAEMRQDEHDKMRARIEARRVSAT